MSEVLDFPRSSCSRWEVDDDGDVTVVEEHVLSGAGVKCLRCGKVLDPDRWAL